MASKTTMSTSRRRSQHGFRGVLKANLPDTTGYDRRRKSDRGVSRRVWEATTTAIRRSTRVLKTHRFCFENGDDWDSQSRAPSVVSRLFKNKKQCFSRLFQKEDDFKNGHSLKSRHGLNKVAVEHFRNTRTGHFLLYPNRDDPTPLTKRAIGNDNKTESNGLFRNDI